MWEWGEHHTNCGGSHAEIWPKSNSHEKSEQRIQAIKAWSWWIKPANTVGEELFQAQVTTGNLAVNKDGSLVAGDGLLDAAAEGELYSHPFWALLLRAGYTPV